MYANTDLGPSHTARVQLLKQRPEPLRVLVVNSNRFFQRVTQLLRHRSSFSEKSANKKTTKKPLQRAAGQSCDSNVSLRPSQFRLPADNSSQGDSHTKNRHHTTLNSAIRMQGRTQRQR